MKRFALMLGLASASLSFGQSWNQPWTPNLPPFESRVLSCATPTPTNRIALDDFRITSSTYTVSRIMWWGTLTSSAQGSRPYYIAIYRDSGCFPVMSSMIYSACVIPNADFVGNDCQGQRVFKFFSSHIPGITFTPGRYWIQISEIDRESVLPGAIDFQWSAHSPIVGCEAVQMNAIGTFIRPLIEPCNQQRVDLAFELV